MTTAAVASFAIVVATTGWLYLVQPHSRLPGTAVADALPLDELSRRSAVPLAVFVVVWGTAALLLGLVVRAARVERLTAGLLLALGIGGWGYLVTGMSLLIVRQIPAHQAFHAAGAREAVYLPAALGGLAGALFGRERAYETRPRAPYLFAWFVAAAGLLGVLDAILPDRRRALIASLAPERVHGLSTALVAPIGLALLVSARGLARRKRRAWQIAVTLLLALVALHLQHRFGFGAIGTGLVAVALLARRSEFDAPGDPTSGRRIVGHAFLLTAGIVGYAVAALWINRVTVDQPFTLAFALRETARAAVGLEIPSTRLSGEFASWFPISVVLLVSTAVIFLLVEWTAPWRHRVGQAAREHQLTRDLVTVWGVDTLAPFVLRGDKSYFFSDDESAFLAYKVVGGIAIVSGDPIGPPDRFGELIGRFIEFAHERGWRLAILGASEAALGVYSAHGLHALYHGDEAVIDVAAFSLEGRPIRKVRQSVHRLERAGYSTKVLRPSEIDGVLREELQAVARAWRGTQPERGFVMALDTLFRLGDEHALFVVGFAPDGSAAGFLHFAVCRGGSALSLSSMPRLRTTPNGFNEWLVCEAVAWARDNDFARLSLNFAPFAALLAPEAELSALQRVQRQALLRLKGRFQLDNLLAFNRKFFPTWQRRFVVYERRLDLPRIGIAALAAEAYLPFMRREYE